MNFLRRIFDHEYKEVEKFKKIAKEIDALDEEYSALSEQEKRQDIQYCCIAPTQRRAAFGNSAAR